MRSNACILLYAKFPEKGKVKTRLARDIGDTHAVELARRFILDIFATFARNEIPVCVCYSPESAEEAFRQWLSDDYTYWPQHGQDLGDRMHRSFQQAFQAGYQRVIVIGSDLPDVPATLIDKAFEQLDTFDAVIGPSDDGGYYLLGFRKETFLPDIFHNMTWSTADVYTETVERIKKAGRTFFQLPEWSDVDDVHDLYQFYKRNQSDQTSHTIAYLKQHNIVSNNK
jgi:rSAM/selenodomain-associated transferase 1